MRGEMLFFNEERGSGFIRTEEGERLYVDRNGFLPGEAPEGRCAGLKVDFIRVEGTGEHEHVALEVSLVEELAGGRARRRRHG